MSLAIRLAVEPVRTVAFGSISGSYMGMGTTFTRPIRMMVLQNLTDKQLMFSWDGINDNLPLPSLGYLILDVSSNKGVAQEFMCAQGTRMYVKAMSAAPADQPSLGSAYLTVFYGAE